MNANPTPVVTRAVSEVMDELAAELKKRRPNERRIEQLNSRLDALLGTTLKPENHKEAARWERSRKEHHDHDE